MPIGTKVGQWVSLRSGKAPTANGRALSELLVSRLSEKLPGGSIKTNVTFGRSSADFVVETPGRIIVAELKTGDPELPLPSSTIPQMGLFVEQAHNLYPDCDIVPIVVTNYQVSEPDKRVLDKEGVRVLSLASFSSVDAVVADLLQQTINNSHSDSEAAAE